MSKPLIIKNNLSFKKIVLKNLRFVIICAVFILSLILGAFSVSVCDDESFFGLAEHFDNFLEFTEKSGFAEMLLYLSFGFSFLILINFVLGLCVIGTFFNPTIMFIYGFGAGAISSYIYCTYSLKGICYFILVLLPGIFLFSLNYILSFDFSFKFSLKLYKSITKNISQRFDLKLYLIRYIYFFILTFIIGLINSFFIKTFSPIFDL